jgi:hypothetical protein
LKILFCDECFSYNNLALPFAFFFLYAKESMFLLMIMVRPGRSDQVSAC